MDPNRSPESLIRYAPKTRPYAGGRRRPGHSHRVRVVGVVWIAVGSECVDVVDDNDVRWTLLGPEAVTLRAGQRVVVTGMPRPEAAGCSGAPLAVQKIAFVP
jgi:hypothetical protein